MRWLLAWLFLWWLTSAGLLLLTGIVLWLLRRFSALRRWDGAAWANATAMALLCPLVIGAIVATSATLSVKGCDLPTSSPVSRPSSLFSLCPHTIRHWCGHASSAARRDVWAMFWVIWGWLGVAGSGWLLVEGRRRSFVMLSPSAKLKQAGKQAGVPKELPLREAVTETPAGLVGFRRPFIFVARWFVQTASLPSLCAVLRHELGHWHRRDHLLRRLLFAVALGFGIVPLVTWLHREWRDASEEAADDWAATDLSTALALAQALQTVQQYRQRSGWTDKPTSKSVREQVRMDGGELYRRIERLRGRQKREQARWMSALCPLGMVIAFIPLTFSLSLTPPLWLTLHCLAETLLL
jgi:beta-lactamase regulating signal transducer with metallopeptidase domain